MKLNLISFLSVVFGLFVWYRTSCGWRRIRDFYYYKIRSEIFFRVLLIEKYVSVKFKYLPLYVLIIVDDSSLTSYDNFMVAHPVVLSN